MNDYGKVKCAFWQRGTGKRLRGDAEAQLVALYLMTCPARSMIGIFHVEIPTITHHTGLDLEGVRKGLERLSQEDFAHYDEADELVFVTNMAREQIGESLTPSDNRHQGTLKLLERVKRHRFYPAFMELYEAPLRLAEPSTPKGKAAKHQAPSKPLPSQKQNQKHLSEAVVVPDPLPPVPRSAERVNSQDVSTAWHRAINQPGGNPGAMHAESSWRVDYETVAAACNAVDGPPQLALAAVCQWFWLAPDGPIQGARINRRAASPKHLAKHVSRDLEAAYAWWMSQKPEAAQ